MVSDSKYNLVLRFDFNFCYYLLISNFVLWISLFTNSSAISLGTFGFVTRTAKTNTLTLYLLSMPGAHSSQPFCNAYFKDSSKMLNLSMRTSCKV